MKSEDTAVIGFWNGSVYLTYAGLMSAVAGIFLSIGGKIIPAFFCLMFSGLCDMFDGKIARAMKRTDEEKLFGIQIDSLCDLVCFGVFPAVLCHQIGVAGLVGDIVLCIFVLFGQVRLGYFNVMEARRQQVETGNRKSYQGVPITTSATFLPLVYLFRPLCGEAFSIVLTVFMAVLAFFYVANIRIPKPGKLGGILLVGVGVISAVLFIIFAVMGVI